MNNIDLENRTAVVTGGAQGFGFAIFKKLIESEFEVIIWHINKKAIDAAI